MDASINITESYAKGIIKKRDKFASKNDFGHALLLAGSSTKMGAAVLATKACQRSGVGLLTSHIPQKLANNIIMHSPETMLSLDKDDDIITSFPNIAKYNSVAIGPGIGVKAPTIKVVKYLLDVCNNSVIFDADAINILSDSEIWYERIPANSILTPHHREFERLVGIWKNEEERDEKQRAFSEQYSCIIVLKGANTAITLPDGRKFVNTTGNPGMATAGSGDVLTGILLSLVAQGYSPANSAVLGVYLHGKAGDLAAADLSQHALIASDIINYLPKAFLSLER